ncbi:MAG TPA: beta-ketoacyl-[acyl-carrier-protein] synthase family protein [Chloroflexota bacterium]|jgi:3-oxoacyl-[acyl-carrier-protein] synthase II
MNPRRVVITGIGAITPIGRGKDGLWQGVRAGRRAGRTITRFDPSPFPSHVAAEIVDFDPLDYIESRRVRRMDRFSQLSVAAARQALEDAGICLGSSELREAAVYLGSALGGVSYAEEQHTRYLADGFHAVDSTLALVVFGGAGATNVAMDLGINGSVIGNANSCASGLIAIGQAFELIRSGATSLALAGGAEAPLAPLAFGAFARVHALTTRNECPESASRPFDRNRDGFMMGEGSAVLVLEDLENALRHDRRPLAEIVGFGVTNDAYHMTAPLASGEQAARAVTLALTQARIDPSDVGYLNAHATGTPLGDAAEARAIDVAFDTAAERLPVSGTKGLHGHALGATGAIEAAITVLALQHGWLPPTANLEEPDPECGLSHVPACGLTRNVEFAVTNSFGFGGINASLVLRPL